jgi:predicted GNAT family N-acyltransferase
VVRIEQFGVEDRARLRLALEIRRRVFVDEQGVPLEEEADEHDEGDPLAVHALAVEAGGAAVGTGRFYEAAPGCAQIGRMAVLAGFRDRGVGAQILGALLAEAGRRGFHRARLLAQLQAIPFYERAGFVAGGERIVDGGILHQPMEATLG